MGSPSSSASRRAVSSSVCAVVVVSPRPWDERNELDVAGDAVDEEGQVVFAGGMLVGGHWFCLSFGVPVCGVGLVQVFSC